jgi:3-hydroxyacyl-[acyl-carrier-protein] dehydratase
MMSSATPRIPLPLPADHPALAGHFPGHPIYPGVVLLDAAIGAIEAHFGAAVLGLPVAKFLAPVRPGMALTLQANRSDSHVRFELATADGVRVATGSAVLRVDDELPRGRP